MSKRRDDRQPLDDIRWREQRTFHQRRTGWMHIAFPKGINGAQPHIADRVLQRLNETCIEILSGRISLSDISTARGANLVLIGEQVKTMRTELLHGG